MENKKPQKNKLPKPPLSPITLMIFTFFFLYLLFNMAKNQNGAEKTYIPFPQVIEQVKKGNVSRIKYTQNVKEIEGTYKDNVNPDALSNKFTSRGDLNSEVYQELLKENNIIPEYKKDKEPGTLATLLVNLLPTLIIFGILIWFFRRSASGGMNSMINNVVKVLPDSGKTVKFKDVAGCEEAKENVRETVDFLKNPQKYFKTGAKIPRGIILEGPPGTGKSLLARATAGEAGVPFYHYVGSDFVQMFVGVGAGRVREIFKEARKNAPAIIFIDEIDSIGGKRSNGLGGGHNEQEQTLNALLAEMQGITDNDNHGLIIMAATNRVDMLDPALTRSGRFDRRVTVGLPDVKGREEILKVHMRNKKIDDNIDINLIARTTPGMSGADLENLVNEALIYAVKSQREKANHKDFEMAKDKLILGDELRSKLISEKDKLITAYHEIGHTLVGMHLETADPLNKVSIIPRGRALGITYTAPKEDNPLSYSRKKLTEMISMLMGGRVAEEIKFEEITTGASNDIERATQIAEQMVCDWGMSSLGPQKIKRDPYSHQLLVSDEMKSKIDIQISKIINDAYELARKILTENFKAFEVLSQELLKKEDLTKAEVDTIVAKLDDYPSPENKPKKINLMEIES